MKEQNLERSLPIYFGQQKAILFQIQAFRFINSILIDLNWTNNKIIEHFWVVSKVNGQKWTIKTGRSKVDGQKWMVKFFDSKIELGDLTGLPTQCLKLNGSRSFKSGRPHTKFWPEIISSQMSFFIFLLFLCKIFVSIKMRSLKNISQKSRITHFCPSILPISFPNFTKPKPIPSLGSIPGWDFQLQKGFTMQTLLEWT